MEQYKNFLKIVGGCFTLCLSACGADDQSRLDASEDFKALVSTYCETSDTIKFSIKSTVIEIPCGYRQHIKLYSEKHEIDYQHPSYFEGLAPIPLNSKQLMVEQPSELEKIWDVTPPAGVVINLYSPSSPKFKQECEEYTDPKRSWCTHYIPIQDSSLGVTLRFDGDSIPTFSAHRAGSITKDNFPYAYYPESKWPELYAETNLFVKSLLVQNE